MIGFWIWILLELLEEVKYWIVEVWWNWMGKVMWFFDVLFDNILELRNCGDLDFYEDDKVVEEEEEVVEDNIVMLVWYMKLLCVRLLSIWDFVLCFFFFVILIIEYEVLVSFIVKSCEVWEKMILVKRKRGEDCMDKVYINI